MIAGESLALSTGFDRQNIYSKDKGDIFEIETVHEHYGGFFHILALLILGEGFYEMNEIVQRNLAAWVFARE